VYIYVIYILAHIFTYLIVCLCFLYIIRKGWIWNQHKFSDVFLSDFKEISISAKVKSIIFAKQLKFCSTVQTIGVVNGISKHLGFTKF